MVNHIKESTLYAFVAVGRAFMYLSMGVVGIVGWMKAVSTVSMAFLIAFILVIMIIGSQF